MISEIIVVRLPLHLIRLTDYRKWTLSLTSAQLMTCRLTIADCRLFFYLLPTAYCSYLLFSIPNSFTISHTPFIKKYMPTEHFADRSEASAYFFLPTAYCSCLLLLPTAYCFSLLSFIESKFFCSSPFPYQVV